MVLKVIGIWLVLDGGFSLVLCSDKVWKYQLARAIRAIFGLVLIMIS